MRGWGTAHCTCPPALPRCVCGARARVKVLTRKTVMPTAEEIRSPGNAKRKMQMRKIVHGEDLEHWRQTNSFYIAQRQREKVAGQLPIRMVIGTEDFSLEGAFVTQDRLTELRIPHEFELLHGVPHNIQQLYGQVGIKGLRHHEAVFTRAN